MLRLSVWRGSGAHMKRLRNVGTNLCASRAQVHNQSKPVIAIRREDNVVSVNTKHLCLADGVIVCNN